MPTHGIAVYWVINLENQQIGVHSQPTVEQIEARSEPVESFDFDAQIPLVSDDLEIARPAARDLIG